MTLLRYLLLGAALIVSIAPAQAQWKEIAKSGNWFAYTGRTDANLPTCIITAKGKDWSVQFKWYDGTNYLEIGKQGWRVPAGTIVPIAIRFDENKPHAGVANGTKQANSIMTRISDDLFATMLQEFTDSSTIQIKFPQGGDRGLSVSLDGAQKVLRAYTKCAVDLERKNAAPQPHQGGGGKEKSIQEDGI